jgi:thiol-disulfide isomerase/thioredoxin
MHRRYVAYFLIAAASLVVARTGLLLAAPLAAAANAPQAPAFTHRAADDWINSPALTWSDLRGQVVLLDFWTFACWNCYRSFPWLHGVEERFGPRGLRVIGVHTPEFAYERIRFNVERKVREFKLNHPVMLDNDHSYWNAMDNRYWPAFYLVDRQGRVRAAFYGETHAGDANARRIESAIENLLTEADQ